MFIDSGLEVFDGSFAVLRRQRVITTDQNTLFLHNGGSAYIKRCKLTFKTVKLQEDLYIIPYKLDVTADHIGIIHYVKESRIERFRFHNESLLLNYLCGDSSRSCNRFYYIRAYDPWVKEIIMCEFCYNTNKSTSDWIIYQMTTYNTQLTCFDVHCHMEGHFHCFICKKDCINSGSCLRKEITNINEAFRYWISEPFDSDWNENKKMKMSDN